MHCGTRPTRRGLFTLAAGTAAAASVAACRSESATQDPTPSPSPTTGARFVGDPGSDLTYLGVSRGMSQSATDVEWLPDTQISMSRRYYQTHQVSLLLDAVTKDHAAGIVPFVSVKPDIPWATMATGDDDGWLESVIAVLALATKPVFLAVHHEPENDHGGINLPADWVAMQHQAIRLARESAPIVTVVPTLMSWTFNPASGRRPRDWEVPNCPLLGVDFYNQWSPGAAAPWTEVLQLVEQVRDVIGPDLPIIAPELGCRDDPDDSQRASRWMTNAFEDADWLGVVGMAWFNSQYAEDREFRLDGNEKAALATLLTRPEVARLPS